MIPQRSVKTQIFFDSIKEISFPIWRSNCIIYTLKIVEYMILTILKLLFSVVVAKMVTRHPTLSCK